VALWGEGCAPAAALLRRTFPPGLLRFLSLGRQPPASPVAPSTSRTQAHSRQQPQQPPPNSAGPSAGTLAGHGAAAASGAQAANRSGAGAPAQPDPLRGAAANGALSSPRSSVNSPRGAPSNRSDAGSSSSAAAGERRTAGSLDGVARPPGQQHQHRPRSAGAELPAGLRTAGSTAYIYEPAGCTWMYCLLHVCDDQRLVGNFLPCMLHWGWVHHRRVPCKLGGDVGSSRPGPPPCGPHLERDHAR
jgi:hypothetical protein